MANKPDENIKAEAIQRLGELLRELKIDEAELAASDYVKGGTYAHAIVLAAKKLNKALELSAPKIDESQSPD